MIRFINDKRYFARHPQECDGGIETRKCTQLAQWTEVENDWHILAVLCPLCKIEVETYVNNQIKEKDENKAKQVSTTNQYTTATGTSSHH